MKHARTVLIVSCTSLVLGVLVSVGVPSLFVDYKQETLRLLRRGDKIDCKQSEMRGTFPLATKGK